MIKKKAEENKNLLIVKPEFDKKKWRTKKWIVIIATIIVTYLVINLFPVRLIRISGDSMHPTYSHSGVVWAKKIYSKKGKQNIDYGDVVVANYSGGMLIKRVVALPHDKVEIKNGILYVNGEKSPANKYYKDGISDAGDFGSIVLNEDEWYLMGDNVNESADSRVFGPISAITYIVITGG